MIECIFTSNTITLNLTDYESQSYLCSVHFLVLDSDMFVGSLCYVWKDGHEKHLDFRSHSDVLYTNRIGLFSALHRLSRFNFTCGNFYTTTKET